jgi:flagellar biosynthetic protein FliR
MLVAGRLSGFLLFAPVFGSAHVPPTVRALLPVVIGLVAAPLLPAGWENAALGATLSLPLLTVLVAAEFLLGVVAALQIQFFLEIWRMAGSMIAINLGLSFAQQVDPTLETEETVLSVLLTQFFIVLFLVTGAHLEFVRLAVASLQHVPPGTLLPAAELAETSGRLAGRIFVGGLHLALPILAIVLFVQAALGLIAKFCQELEVLMLALPLQLGLGVVLLTLLIPVFAGVMHSHLAEALDRIATLVAQ